MRYVALAFIFGLVPVMVTLLRSSAPRRGWALMLLSALFLLGGFRSSSFLVAWPLWPGLTRGLEVSVVDMIALALIMTRRRLPGRLPFWPVIIAYGASLTLSLMWTSVRMATFFSVWQFARMILLFVAISGELHRPDARQGLINGLSLGLLFQAVYVVCQKMTGVVQAGGTVGHQNTLGLMVELVLLPLIASALGGNRSRLLLVGILSGLVIVGGGGSRATIGFVGAGIIGLGILSLIRRVTTRKMQVVAVGCLALAVAAPFSYLTLKERFGGSSLVTREDERTSFERAAMAIAHDFPMGIGSNMYVTVAASKGYNARAGVVWHKDAYSIPVHNAYLLSRAETGLFGEFTLILLLLVPMLRALIFAFKYRGSGRAEIVLGCAVGLTLNLLHNRFEFATLSAVVLPLVMTNLGIIAAEIRVAKIGGNKTARYRRIRAGSSEVGPTSPLPPSAAVTS